jgi:16S rRNA (uracil1498-N3)-methyltransferase
MEVGDTLTLFDGRGGQYTAVVAEIGKKRASAAVQAFKDVEAELPYAVTLAQGLPEGSKMDWIIEKAVELGATAVQPLAARRSVVRLAGERAEKRHAHWQSVIEAASAQCGRNRLAQLAAVDDIGRYLSETAGQLRILFSPRASESLAAWAYRTEPQPVIILVGPEGGFTPEEEAAAIEAGAISLSLGPRVLRTETAGLAALASLGALWQGM